MNNKDNEILHSIFSRCNRPQGLTSSVSIPISESRCPKYHNLGVDQRIRCHNHLKAIESAVLGFSLEFSSSGFGDIPLLKRISAEDTRALLDYCDIPVQNDEILNAITQLCDLDIHLPDWCKTTISDISDAWLAGKTAFGCSVSSLNKLIEALTFVSWYFTQEITPQKDMRTISVLLYSDSKKLESLLSIIARIVAPNTPKAIQSKKPKDIMEYWGISKFPPSFKCKASIEVHTLRGILDTSTAWPYLEIPPDGIINLTSLQNPDYILFIENKTTFERYSREIDDKGWVFYTNGFPSRRWQDLFKNIVDLVPKDTPVYHWGDLDEGGYRILTFMNNLLQCDIIPYKMLNISNGKPSKYIKLKNLVGIIENEKSSAIYALHEEILMLMETSTEIPWVEQEALSIMSPLEC
ncbi:MAG: hypothetical protein ACI9D5_002754 [Candidatus Endobugula sp.]